MVEVLRDCDLEVLRNAGYLKENELVFHSGSGSTRETFVAQYSPYAFKIPSNISGIFQNKVEAEAWEEISQGEYASLFTEVFGSVDYMVDWAEEDGKNLVIKDAILVTEKVTPFEYDDEDCEISLEWGLDTLNAKTPNWLDEIDEDSWSGSRAINAVERGYGVHHLFQGYLSEITNIGIDEGEAGAIFNMGYRDNHEIVSLDYGADGEFSFQFRDNDSSFDRGDVERSSSVAEFINEIKSFGEEGELEYEFV